MPNAFAELQAHMGKPEAGAYYRGSCTPCDGHENRTARGAYLSGSAPRADPPRGTRAGSPIRPSRLTRMAEPIRSKRALTDPVREANLAMLAKQLEQRVPLGESTLLATRVEQGPTPAAYYRAKAKAARDARAAANGRAA
jgi:hypothetical protein